MSLNKLRHGFFAAAVFSLLVLSGCATPVEIPELDAASSSITSRAEAVDYLNSVKLANFEDSQKLCNFNRGMVELVASYEEDVPLSSGYQHMQVSKLAAWENIGRTGLWLHYDATNPMIDFFEKPGCKVLGRNATDEEIVKAAQALVYLGANYVKP